MRKRSVSLLVSGALAALTSGCMLVGPDYERPPVQVPSDWRLPAGTAAELTNSPWWQQFGDPVLDRLITTALENNRDLKLAAARVEQFQGQLTATTGEQFPLLDAAGTAGRERLSADQRLPGESATLGVNSLAAGVSFELDLWGKLRRATESARAQLLSSEEARRTVVLTLVSGVATSYISLRDFDARLAIARNTLASRAESLRIAKLRFQAGITSELDLRQAESEYESTQAVIPQLEQAIAQQENALSVLLGRDPGPIERGRSLAELRAPAIPAGLPSDLLERRPDIRDAEQQLIAANAQIGVARAAYFPTISLTGQVGTASTQLGELFTGPARVWQYALPVSVPIFTFGRIEGSVAATEAVQRQALESYRKSIQTAFREVDDGLIAARKTREQGEAQRRQTEALARYLKLARLRYDNGYTSYLEVVDAERNLFNAQLSLVQTRGSELSALIGLYKAMGGGWVVDATASAPAAQGLAGQARPASAG